MPGGEAYESVVSTYFRTADDVAALKERYKSEGMNFSTNDVLCGEICEILDIKRILLVMEWRTTVGLPDLFGTAMTFCNFEAESPAQIPAELRSVLPKCRSADYARWKIGQPFNRVDPLTMNSWVRAFDTNGMFAAK